ncbi:MAG TPA: Lrp/AsnC family transcriptional regulator [Euryarchaeota archaeon]|nr:Lrp/AsnC family transcriptional regulator [Euryarchaeota archaeon]
MKQSYVLLKTKGGKVSDIYAKLQDREYVEDAAITLGEHDIIAKLNVESDEELYSFYKEFNSLDGVEVVSVLPSFIDKTNGTELEVAGVVMQKQRNNRTVFYINFR